jgi:DNA invertase Pin-like site-specific DNA recombinase
MTPEDIRKVLKLQRNLAKLPLKYGFPTMGEFVAALQEILKSGGPVSGKDQRKRRRGKVTDKVREKVRKLLLAGISVREVAKKRNLSAPTIYSIKKNLDLEEKISKSKKIDG